MLVVLITPTTVEMMICERLIFYMLAAAPSPPLPSFVPQAFVGLLGICLSLPVDADIYTVCFFDRLSLRSGNATISLGRMNGYIGNGNFSFGGGDLCGTSPRSGTVAVVCSSQAQSTVDVGPGCVYQIVIRDPGVCVNATSGALVFFILYVHACFIAGSVLC